jgi:mRNA-degrading endonuclease RelE of RelBE toxin-antitoxin system
MITEVAIADSFEEALSRLEKPDAKRARHFMSKLCDDPGRAGLGFEIVRRQPDRNMRSARVSLEMRVIAYQCSGMLTLLWVDHHDAAYAWARSRCVECHPVTGRVIRVVEAPEPG